MRTRSQGDRCGFPRRRAGSRKQPCVAVRWERHLGAKCACQRHSVALAAEGISRRGVADGRGMGSSHQARGSHAFRCVSGYGVRRVARDGPLQQACLPSLRRRRVGAKCEAEPLPRRRAGSRKQPWVAGRRERDAALSAGLGLIPFATLKGQRADPYAGPALSVLSLFFAATLPPTPPR